MAPARSAGRNRRPFAGRRWRARAPASISNGSSRASMITKSLPSPCILWKCRASARAHLGSGQTQVHQPRVKPHAESRQRGHAIDPLLGGARRHRRAEDARPRGLPNQLLRDVQAIHPNVTFADLPKELQDARSEYALGLHAAAEGRLCVGPRQQMQVSRPLDRVPERQRHAPGSQDRRGPPRGPRRGPRRPDQGAARASSNRPRKPKGKPKF